MKLRTNVKIIIIYNVHDTNFSNVIKHISKASAYDDTKGNGNVLKVFTTVDHDIWKLTSVEVDNIEDNHRINIVDDLFYAKMVSVGATNGDNDLDRVKENDI